MTKMVRVRAKKKNVKGLINYLYSRIQNNGFLISKKSICFDFDVEREDPDEWILQFQYQTHPTHSAYFGVVAIETMMMREFSAQFKKAEFKNQILELQFNISMNAFMQMFEHDRIIEKKGIRKLLTLIK